VKPTDGLEKEIQLDEDEDDRSPAITVDNDDEDFEITDDDRNEATKQTQTAPSATTKVSRELAKLHTHYNPTIEEEEPEVNLAMTATLQSDPGVPKQYKDIEKSTDPPGWHEAVNRELKSIAERKVFGDPQNTLPKGAKAIGTRWVFKEKDNGLKKARLVVLGYNQIPGVDYTETFAPVASNQAIHFLFAMSLYAMDKGQDWKIDVIDVETAFLNADLEETVYIKKPEGSTIKESYVPLNKALYGLVQAPRAWFKRMSTYLRGIGEQEGLTVEQSKIDPCLFYIRKGNTLTGMISLYVDDCIIAGPNEIVELLKKKISEEFNIKDLGSISKYLGVDYSIEKDDVGHYIKADLSKYMKAVVDDFEKDFGHVKESPNPGVRGEREPTEEPIEQSKYRSYVGRLMFGVSKCMPECASAIRDLSTHLEDPGPTEWKRLKKFIGYLKHYKYLKIRSPRSLKIIVFVDSDYASDKADRKSVTGIIVTIGGCFISCRSMKQTGVTLSSTEAEYVALSTAGTEVKFLTNLLNEATGELQEVPVIYEDNQGAIFLVNNQQMGQRTKHIDIRYKFMNEMVANKEVEVKYVKSEDNVADIASKVTGNQTFERLSHRIREGLMVMEDHVLLASEWKGVEQPQKTSQVWAVLFD